jgi:4-hydroxy-2-oxoglutarate aldolase
VPKKFRGIFAALVSPFVGEDLSIEKFKDNIQKYNASGLAGYVVLGSTGECVSLSDEESTRLVRAAKEAAAKKKKVIAGTARESTKLTLEFTNAMADLGIDAALVRPPSYYKSKMSGDALKKHYLTLADKSSVPLIIYNIPQNTGISLESRLIMELSLHSNIIGLKESAGNLSFLGEVAPKVPAGFSYLLGSGNVILPGLVMGACGAILAVANAAPDICLQIFHLFQENKIEAAAKLQQDLIPLNKAIMETYGIPGLKFALDAQGYNGGSCRLPLLPIEEQGRAELCGLLKKLGLTLIGATHTAFRSQ